ncbi:hypothetical protein C8R44DRAFT_873732 [Mycena epipterygia]|nr:hypothetical protein C8R44DRAFT_873732 [Mycena epipterygia]
MTPISVPVAKQPSMDMYGEHALAEKPLAHAYHSHGHAHAHDLDEDAQWSSASRPGTLSHKPCHNGRLRRFLLPAVVALVVLSGLAALFCFSMADPGEIIEGIFHVKRAVTGDGTGSTGTESSFTKHKLYLIVVFVGLFVVLVLAVMLSAWCCRGAFENPCCCPCYLCACCGGLACLECIGCGLCAEGVDQM